jgi:hypothetical protein
VSGPYATLAVVTDVEASSSTPSDAAPALSADELVRLTGGRLADSYSLRCQASGPMATCTSPRRSNAGRRPYS